MDGVAPIKICSHEGMTNLVKGDGFSLFVRKDPAAFFKSGHYAFNGFVEVLLGDLVRIAARGQQCSFVDERGQIRT